MRDATERAGCSAPPLASGSGADPHAIRGPWVFTSYIESRWVSKALAFAGQLRPRRHTETQGNLEHCLGSYHDDEQTATPQTGVAPSPTAAAWR
jgi:hypothetical protein